MATKKTEVSAKAKKAAPAVKAAPAKKAPAAKKTDIEMLIRMKAEEIYNARVVRGEHGSADDDWHKAEKLVKAGAKKAGAKTAEVKKPVAKKPVAKKK